MMFTADNPTVGSRERENVGRILSGDLAVGHLLAAQEHDWQRVARELHDGPIQDVIAAQFLVAALAGDDEAGQAVQDALQGVTEALRAVCQALYPPALEPFGLFKAVESLVDKLASSEPTLAVQLERTGDDQALPLGVQQQLFRVVQELLANVRAHAQAQHVTVTLAVDDKGVIVRVVDDGIGVASKLEAAACAKLAQEGRYGLFRLMSRAHTLGGELVVAPRPEDGTVAMLTIPNR